MSESYKKVISYKSYKCEIWFENKNCGTWFKIFCSLCYFSEIMNFLPLKREEKARELIGFDLIYFNPAAPGCNIFVTNGL